MAPDEKGSNGMSKYGQLEIGARSQVENWCRKEVITVAKTQASIFILWVLSAALFSWLKVPQMSFLLFITLNAGVMLWAWQRKNLNLLGLVYSDQPLLERLFFLVTGVAVVSANFCAGFAWLFLNWDSIVSKAGELKLRRSSC